MIDGSALLSGRFKIIDISQPISTKTACFLGDVPFSRQVTVSHEDSGVINLTALTMSPHVGTHIDAPVHVRGTMSSGEESAGSLPLSPFFGPVTVLDVSPCKGAITPEHLEPLEFSSIDNRRVLIKTNGATRFDVFEDSYAYLTVEAADWLKEQNVILVGLDTPSVDHTESKSLDAHHKLLADDIYWLENLDLNAVTAGDYFLVAFPLRFMELEASPVRAVLISTDK